MVPLLSMYGTDEAEAFRQISNVLRVERAREIIDSQTRKSRGHWHWLAQSLPLVGSADSRPTFTVTALGS
jgi:hypothetical protein